MTTGDANNYGFDTINRAYATVFKTNKLSVGLVVPIENYSASPVPAMRAHIERVQLAESLGFSAVWLRDVPFNVPSFGDAGQIYDPFVYLGLLAGATEQIGLGVASLILPLRHPAHVAKAAASADVLSGGRLLLGIASGDRPDEYPAMNLNYDDRGERFRASYDYIRNLSEPAPVIESHYGVLNGTIDMLPKPNSGKIPLLITGNSRQSPEWIAGHGDGWMTFPRQSIEQQRVIQAFRNQSLSQGLAPKPVMQPLYIDLAKQSDKQPQPIHLGFKSGVSFLISYLKQIEKAGVNHVALNLRFNEADIEHTLERLACELLPEFK